MLLQLRDFVMHSGEPSFWKIECDSLDAEDIAAFARLIVERSFGPDHPHRFDSVVGVPRGGDRIADAVWVAAQCRRTEMERKLLIVDDVLTSGTSMEEKKEQMIYEGWAEGDIRGVVLFARRRARPWVHPVFQFWGT